MGTWGVSGNLANNGDVLQDPPSPDAFDDQSTCAVDVTGDYNGDIVVEVCGQNHVFYPITLWKTGDPITAVQKITGPGLYRCNVSAMVSCRARLENNTSGTAYVTLYATPAYIEPVSSGSSAASSLPMYDQTGTALPSTAHIVQGTITATSNLQTVNLAGAAAFQSATSYTVYVMDNKNSAFIPLSAKTANSFTFQATPSDPYNFMAIGY